MYWLHIAEVYWYGGLKANCIVHFQSGMLLYLYQRTAQFCECFAIYSSSGLLFLRAECHNRVVSELIRECLVHCSFPSCGPLSSSVWSVLLRSGCRGWGTHSRRANRQTSCEKAKGLRGKKTSVE